MVTRSAILKLEFFESELKFILANCIIASIALIQNLFEDITPHSVTSPSRRVVLNSALAVTRSAMLKFEFWKLELKLIHDQKLLLFIP